MEKIFEIIFYGFISVATIQVLFYLIFFARIFKKNKKAEVLSEKVPVSVIVVARNEAENLQKFLPTVLEQNYPDFEVIVVNDSSSDNSDDVLRQFQAKYERLYVTTIPQDQQFSHGKKLALTVGIKAAKNDWLLFTDADCIVDSQNWIEQMAQNFSEKSEIVLGYGGYIKKRGLLNLLVRYDTVFIALQYLTFAMSGLPYMGVGRNMAYRKTLFFKNKGFASHLKLLSGSDDLFVNENATKSNTRVEFSPDSFTHSEAKTTWSDWLFQKQRHYSTGKYYKLKHKILFGLEPVTRILFYLLFVPLIVYYNQFTYQTIVIFSVFVLRELIFSAVIIKASKVFKERGLIFFAIFFDFVQPFVNFIVLLSKAFYKKRKNRWR